VTRTKLWLWKTPKNAESRFFCNLWNCHCMSLIGQQGCYCYSEPFPCLSASCKI